MNSNQLKRFLSKNNCIFQNHRGGSGNLTIINRENNKRCQLPMHGKKELGKGLVEKILK